MMIYYQDAVKQVLSEYGMEFCGLKHPVNEDRIAIIYRLGQYEYYFHIDSLEELQNQRMDAIHSLVESKLSRSKSNGLHR